MTGGISESDLGNGKIEIKVVGNDWTSYDAMEDMWRRKAATIAAKRGNGNFQTLQFNVGREAYGLNVLGGAKVARGIIQIRQRRGQEPNNDVQNRAFPSNQS